MTKLIVGQLQGVSNTITMPAGHAFAAPGGIIQVIYRRTDARVNFAAPISGNGTPVTDLAVGIAPKKANSLILLRWMVNGEMHHDTVFTLQISGDLISIPGYEGYNAVSGNVRWSGIATGRYDRDVNSTPNNWYIQYVIPANNTNFRSYNLGVRSSSGAAYIFSLNKPTNDTAPAQSYEALISTGVALELAQ
jgi:hypothetical protein